uniref:N-alpha-acetyltransferase 35, NatC auxiliary subunit n=1 Tax=Noctiluca scintillans TaxID=2966 RepID=A0A7S1ALC8_NOCSC
MSAIEIMHPHMDSGFKNCDDMSLDKAVEAGIIGRSLELPDLVAIWDHMLMYYLMWLEGHTIVQTFFCCLHLHELQKYVSPMPLFGAFVDAFLVVCRLARKSVIGAGVFDDEDFLPNLFNVDLEASVYSSSPSEVEERITQECKKLEASQAGVAAASRLHFISAYMTSLIQLETGTRGTSEELASCPGLVELMRKNKVTASPDALRCFDPSINRKLLVPGPPHEVHPLEDQNVVLDHWVSHLEELRLCGSLFDKPMSELIKGAVTYKDESNVLSRSVAQLCVQEPGFLRKLMLEALSQFEFPLEALEHCKATETLLERCESLMAHLLRLGHANRARRFRRLAHVFADFNVLQHEAYQLDEDLKETFGANLKYTRPCWMWIMEQCLQTMLNKLFLGFELDLYDVSEFQMIYWYADYLYGLRVYNLNELYVAKEQACNDKKKKGRNPSTRNAGPQGRRAANPPRCFLLLEAMQNTVRGLFRLLAFCTREEILKLPPMAAEGLAQRFVLRFRCFEHFRLPHLPSFRDFQQSSASAQAPVKNRVVLEAAQSSFSEANQALEKIAAVKGSTAADDVSPESIKALKRVIVANQLAASQLHQRLLGGTTSSLTVATTHHKHLVSVQVVAGS